MGGALEAAEGLQTVVDRGSLWREWITNADLPNLELDAFNSFEVSVACNQHEAMALRHGCDPDVVFWKRSAVFSEVVLDEAILPGHRCVAANHRSARCKPVDAGNIFFEAG